MLLAAAALAFLLIEPHFEGRNAHATLFEVYFKDPVLAYVYLASIPIFIGLYQAFKALDEREPSDRLRTIRYCALAVVGFTVLSLGFAPFGDPEDRPQGLVMRLVVALAAWVVGFAASKLERRRAL